MASFTDIVSLGYRCRTSRRLNDHFGQQRTFPFDRWVTPLKGAMRFVQDWNVDALYDARALRETHIDARLAYLKHERYGIKLHHDFPFEGGAKSISPQWRGWLAEARSRTRYLMDRFEALNRAGNRVLFVRELDRREERAPDFAFWLKGVVQQRMRKAETAFLLISPTGVAVDGWTPLKIDDPKTDPWEGDADLWNSALATLGHELEPLERPATHPSNRHAGHDPEARAG